MENASKALLIAGGILVSILVITVFIYMITRISEFRRSNEDLARIENVSEFNKRFTNYQREKVYGYELISLANRVADYNFRRSNYIAKKEGVSVGTVSNIINDLLN